MDAADGRIGTGGVTVTATAAGAAAAGGRGRVFDSAEVVRLLAELEDASVALAGGDCVRLDNAELLSMLVALESTRRRVEAVGLEVIDRLREQDGARRLVGTGLVDFLVDALHISVREARARMRAASDLAPRVGMTGERLPASRELTAAAYRDGGISAEHARVIRDFFTHLPADVDEPTRVHAEGQLVDLARQASPAAVRAAADRLLAYLDPDGSEDDERTRRRRTYFRIDPQRRDGMSTGRFCVDPELRSYLEALFAAYARPGRCDPENPAGEAGGDRVDAPPRNVPADRADGDAGPDASAESTCLSQTSSLGGPVRPARAAGPAGCACASGAAGPAGCAAESESGTDLSDTAGPSGPSGPSGSAGPDGSAGLGGPAGPDGPGDLGNTAVPSGATDYRDTRTQGQRNADAIKAGLRALLASGALGAHRGLPVRVVVTASLADIEHAAGFATTGGGTLLPMSDVLRMAGHAYHYLSIFDDSDGAPLYLGRAKRIATPAQRLTLYAGHGGCTFPGCTNPAYYTEAHHLDEWSADGRTDADVLTLACPRHHALVTEDEYGWATTTIGPGHPLAGRTLWHPPAAIDPDRTGRLNHYHHPGEYLTPQQENAYPTYRQQRKRGRPGTGRPARR